MIRSYELIHDLISNENIYSDKLKNRVKVNEIFNEIDISANNNLKKFIKLSHTRYKNIKSGIPINNFLSKQKPEYDELSNKILTNDLYQSNDVENEVQKLYKKVGKKEWNELNKLRKSILVSSRNLPKNEILLRQQYEEKINSSKNLVQKDENKELEMQILKSLKKDKNLTLDDKKKFLVNILENDSKFINSNIQSYKNFLKDIEKTQDNEKIIKIMSKNNNLGHEYNFKINNMKFLSFKPELKEKIVSKKIEEGFDFKKLAQYTRHGNKKWFQRQLKENSIKRMNSLRRHLNDDKNKNYGRNFFNKKKQKKCNSSSNIYLNMNINKSSTTKSLNEIYNINKNISIYDNRSGITNNYNKTIFGNFRNTIKTVKSEAEFIKNIGQNFEIKRKTVNKFFKSYSLPKLEDYEKLEGHHLSGNNTNKSNNKETKVINKEKDRDSNNSSIYDFNFVKQKDDKDSNDIMEIYKSTFYNKMEKWNEEELQKKEKKKKEMLQKENNRKYLNQLRAIKRKPNLFVDVYSLRDGIINEKIKLLNNSLNIPIYSKNLRLDIINDFNNFIQKKEKERILNQELMKKKLMEEEELIKEHDEQYQLMKKMKKNLNLENYINNDEEKIKFNYKYFSNINNNKKGNQNAAKEAYKEYLISFKNIKLKNELNIKDKNGN